MNRSYNLFTDTEMLLPDPSDIQAKLDPDSPLFGLIEEAYLLFGGPKPTSTEVCAHCCMRPEIEDDFFNPQIRELPLQYIRDWFGAAYDSAGIAKATWAYLLPRILEILAAGDEPSSVGLEVSLSRFGTGNRANWTDKQWSVLDRFQREFLCLKIGHGNEPLDDLLCMFRLAGWPLGGLVEQVASMPTTVLTERLWQDWCAHHVPGREAIWVTAFWESPDSEAVFDFYTSAPLHERISSLGLSETGDTELAAKAMAVANIIELHAFG